MPTTARSSSCFTSHPVWFDRECFLFVCRARRAGHESSVHSMASTASHVHNTSTESVASDTSEVSLGALPLHRMHLSVPLLRFLPLVCCVSAAAACVYRICLRHGLHGDRRTVYLSVCRRCLCVYRTCLSLSVCLVCFCTCKSYVHFFTMHYITFDIWLFLIQYTLH
jgi:hypothetical protein